jgi:hypothetical protein
VVLEQFLKPLAAALGHFPRVLPSVWRAGGGLDAWYRLHVLGE